MKIDAHQHFWKYDPARDSWITDEMAALKHDFLPPDLIPLLQSSAFEGSIAIQAAQSEDETRFLLTLAEDNPCVAGVVGWVDLTAPNVAERLAYFRRFEKLCGFRHIVQAESDERFMLRADFRRGISRLSGFGFTYDILIFPKQLPAAIELASAHPAQKFVLDHLAKPFIKTARLDPWDRLIRELAANPNVFCKLSGLVTEADWARWRLDDFKPYLDVVFDAFGPSRLMFGSDWPVCLLASKYSQVVHLVASYMEGFSADEKAAVFGGNAASFYGLKVLRDGLGTER
jgi:L-fucono-1,5-lactonase